MFLNYRHLCPGARGKAARNSFSRDRVTRSPRRSNVTFSRILCSPPSAARVWATFSQKTSSHSRGVERIVHFATPLEREPPFWPEMLPARAPRVFFDRSEKIDFRSGGVVKIATLIFTRVLQTKIALQKSIISRVGDSFLKRKGNSR